MGKIKLVSLSLAILMLFASVGFAGGLAPKWSEDIRVTHSSAANSYQSIMVGPGDEIHISYAEGMGGSGWFQTRYYSRLDRDGNLVVANTNLPFYTSQGPAAMGVDSGGNLHFAFHGYEEIYHRLIDKFGNQSPVTKINLTRGFNTDLPKMAIGPDNKIYLTYQDEANDPYQGDSNYRRDIFFQRYSWDGIKLIFEIGPIELTIAEGVGYPNVGYVNDLGNMILDGQQNIHVFWSDWRDYGNHYRNELYYKKLDKDGNTLIEEMRLTEVDGLNSGVPTAGMDKEDNLHIFWPDSRDGVSQLYYMKLDNDGNVIVPARKVDTRGNIRAFSSIVDVRGDNHLVWIDGPSGDYRLNYVALDKTGVARGDSSVVAELGNTLAYYHERPQLIGIDSKYRIHVVWADGRDGNWEIYYKYADLADKNPPAITLLGNSEVTIEAGTEYIDAGATALDDVDGDLTSAIVVGNPVDTSVVGTYTVTYNVSDAGGNAAAEVTRTVTVMDTIPPKVAISVDRDLLWPPNHKLVDILVDGTASDIGSGIALVEIAVSDEYGEYGLTVDGFGSTVALEASRLGKDKDGRVYTLTVTATDVAGNVSTSIAEVLVPHDMDKK